MARRKAPAPPRTGSTLPPHSRQREAGAHSSAPPERVSHTKIATDEPPTSVSEVTLRGLDDPRETPLDKLFVGLLDLPFSDGDAAAVQAFVDALGAALPAHAVGVCLVGAAVPSDDAAPSEPRPRQRVFVHLGAGRARGVDPTRIFPGYAHERVFDLGGEAAGSTLHVASDDPRLEDDRSGTVHVARRAAAALRFVLANARAHSAARRAQRELRNLESQVIQADKLASFGQIAAGVVHELNNPLTSIAAYTDLMLRKSHADPGDVDRLKRISESANRMLRFTRDLVTYARPSSEVAVPVVLHTVIDQALAFCEHVIAESGATVDRRYGTGVLTVRGRPEQLTQVFVNLFTNACHAVAREKSGGRIVVTTEAAGDRRVRVVVSDDGHGIAAEHLPHVFAPFFTTKGEGRGTGLGLSIVRNIVEHHGGTIRVASSAPGGTTFTLELPVGR